MCEPLTSADLGEVRCLVDHGPPLLQVTLQSATPLMLNTHRHPLRVAGSCGLTSAGNNTAHLSVSEEELLHVTVVRGRDCGLEIPRRDALLHPPQQRSELLGVSLGEKLQSRRQNSISKLKTYFARLGTIELGSKRLLALRSEWHTLQISVKQDERETWKVERAPTSRRSCRSNSNVLQSGWGGNIHATGSVAATAPWLDPREFPTMPAAVSHN